MNLVALVAPHAAPGGVAALADPLVVAQTVQQLQTSFLSGVSDKRVDPLLAKMRAACDAAAQGKSIHAAINGASPHPHPAPPAACPASDTTPPPPPPLQLLDPRRIVRVVARTRAGLAVRERAHVALAAPRVAAAAAMAVVALEVKVMTT